MILVRQSRWSNRSISRFWMILAVFWHGRQGQISCAVCCWQMKSFVRFLRMKEGPQTKILQHNLHVVFNLRPTTSALAQHTVDEKLPGRALSDARSRCGTRLVLSKRSQIVEHPKVWANHAWLLCRFGTNKNRVVATYWQHHRAKMGWLYRCSGLLCLKELCYPLQMRCILGHAEFVIKEILGAYSVFMTHKVMTIFWPI